MTDAHIHIGRNGGRRLAEPYDGSIRALLRGYAGLGITGLRDAGDDLMLGGMARDIAVEHGIKLETPLAALSHSGGYGDFLGKGVSSEREIIEVMRELFRQKPDFVKIIQSGIVSFDNFGEVSQGGFERELYGVILKIARDNGLKTMVHVNGADNIMRALEFGADSIEHGYFISVRELHFMAERGVIWVPTLAPLSNYLSHSSNDSLQRKVISKTISGHISSIKRAVELGVKVKIGSDAGAAYVPHGQGTLDEMCLFEDAVLHGNDGADYFMNF